MIRLQHLWLATAQCRFQKGINTVPLEYAHAAPKVNNSRPRNVQLQVAFCLAVLTQLARSDLDCTLLVMKANVDPDVYIPAPLHTKGYGWNPGE
jgi:hypothetical protein